MTNTVEHNKYVVPRVATYHRKDLRLVKLLTGSSYRKNLILDDIFTDGTTAARSGIWRFPIDVLVPVRVKVSGEGKLLSRE